VWVTIGSGEGKGVSVHVEGERFLVGTGDECQLKLADPSVATLHAYFEVEPEGRVLLHDLGSDQGTLLNGRKIDAPAVIEGGEEIRVGDTVLSPTVEDPEVEARQRAAALLGERSREAPVSVKTDEGDVIEVVPEHGDGDEGPHLRVKSEDQVVEVVPVGEHRRLRERIGLATGLAALAGVIAVAALVVFLATRGGGTATTADIVKDARSRTVLIDAKAPEGESRGSGFVFDAKRGLVVTNFHVVNGGQNLLVGVNGDIRDASLFSAAPCDDLAVLKVDDASGMQDFPLASQGDIKEGDRTVAVGYPANAALDTPLTSTEGVVSVARTSFNAPTADGPSYGNVVQTDAAINPGNSGGPLINDDKKLIGVNAAVLESQGGVPIQGQGYAIGVDRVKEVLQTLGTGKSQGFAGFGILFPPNRPKGARNAALAVPMRSGAKGAFLLEQVNGTPIRGNFAGYCDAVRSVDSGQTAVLTVVTKPGAAPKRVSVKFQ
jgi:S1-C subfamily serine protease